MIIHDSTEHSSIKHKAIHSEGTWKLCEEPRGYRWVAPGTHPYYLHHRCKEAGHLTATRQCYADFAWGCRWCKSEVPEGLQAMWVMLTGDMGD